MTMPRYAARTDSNQAEIVDALKKIGADVYVLGRPVDLLVGYRKRNFLIEVKTETAKPRKDQQEQRDWIKDWKGQVRVVTNAEEAIRLVTMAYEIH